MTVPLWPQLPTATLNGIVEDAQGARLLGVTVTATNLATGARRVTITSDENGTVLSSSASSTSLEESVAVPRGRITAWKAVPRGRITAWKAVPR